LRKLARKSNTFTIYQFFSLKRNWRNCPCRSCRSSGRYPPAKVGCGSSLPLFTFPFRHSCGEIFLLSDLVGFLWLLNISSLSAYRRIPYVKAVKQYLVGKVKNIQVGYFKGFCYWEWTSTLSNHWQIVWHDNGSGLISWKVGYKNTQILSTLVISCVIVSEYDQYFFALWQRKLISANFS